MISKSRVSNTLVIIGGVVSGALLGVAVGVALFVYESKHEMEASY